MAKKSDTQTKVDAVFAQHSPHIHHLCKAIMQDLKRVYPPDSLLYPVAYGYLKAKVASQIGIVMNENI